MEPTGNSVPPPPVATEVCLSIPPPPPVTALMTQQLHQRPNSVVVIAILFFVGAAVEALGLRPSRAYGDGMMAVNLLDSIVFFIALITVGVGLLRARTWSRVTAIWVIVARFTLMIPLSIPEIERQLPLMQANLGAFWFGMAFAFLMLALFYGTLIYFLTRPAMKAFFRADAV